MGILKHRDRERLLGRSPLSHNIAIGPSQQNLIVWPQGIGTAQTGPRFFCSRSHTYIQTRPTFWMPATLQLPRKFGAL